MLRKEAESGKEHAQLQLTEEEKKILALLEDGPRQMEELCRLTGMNVAALGMHMTMLEMKQVIYTMPGKFFGLQK